MQKKGDILSKLTPEEQEQLSLATDQRSLTVRAPGLCDAAKDIKVKVRSWRWREVSEAISVRRPTNEATMRPSRLKVRIWRWRDVCEDISVRRPTNQATMRHSHPQ